MIFCCFLLNKINFEGKTYDYLFHVIFSIEITSVQILSNRYASFSRCVLRRFRNRYFYTYLIYI